MKKKIQCRGPFRCNQIPKDNDGQTVQHSDHMWNSALHEEDGQSDEEIYQLNVDPRYKINQSRKQTIF